MIVLLKCIKMDLPVHCIESQIVGNWVLYFGPIIESSQISDYSCGWDYHNPN